MKFPAATLLVTLTACSFGMKTGEFEPPHEPHCHRWLHPIADSILAGAAGALAVAVELDNREQNELESGPGGLGTAPAVVFAGISVVYAVSAVVGFKRSLRCADEHHAYERWTREHPEPPGPD